MLIDYHDAFRLRFNKKDNSQYYDNKAKIEKINVIDVSKTLLKERITYFAYKIAKITLTYKKGPTYSIAYIHGFEDGSSRIFLALHHLIVDAVSWRILTHNLKDLYTQATSGETLSLGNKLTSYRQWSNIVNNYYNINKQEKEYWNIITKDIVESNKNIRQIII